MYKDIADERALLDDPTPEPSPMMRRRSTMTFSSRIRDSIRRRRPRRASDSVLNRSDRTKPQAVDSGDSTTSANTNEVKTKPCPKKRKRKFWFFSYRKSKLQKSKANDSHTDCSPIEIDGYPNGARPESITQSLDAHSACSENAPLTDQKIGSTVAKPGSFWRRMGSLRGSLRRRKKHGTPPTMPSPLSISDADDEKCDKLMRHPSSHTSTSYSPPCSPMQEQDMDLSCLLKMADVMMDGSHDSDSTQLLASPESDIEYEVSIESLHLGDSDAVVVDGMIY